MSYYAYHLALREEDFGGVTLVITPGDPERCEKIASAIGPFQVLAFHREFKSVLVSGRKGKVLVVSSGIGGASLSIMVEELARLGVKVFLRVGTCGAIQEHISVGDLIVSEGAVRMDGVSEHYAPIAYPACADFELVRYLKNACEDLGYRYHIGVTCSSATFYPGQERYDTFTGYVLRDLQGSFKEWQKLGILNYEMEVATLFTMTRVFGLRAGAICGVLVNRVQNEQVSLEAMEEVEWKLAQVARLTAERILEGGL
ncbi:MAG: uridine phosphorylase [Atribacterota bacterium]